jgi:hypothetical protein
MDPQQAQHAHHILRHFFHFILIFYVTFVVLFAVPILQIAKRTGLQITLGLLPLIGPLGVLIAAWIIAFAGWKPSAA